MRVYSYQTPKISTSGKSPKLNKPRKKSRFKLGWKRFFTWAFRLLALGIVLIAVLFLYYSKDLPDPNKLLDRNVPQSTKIYARDGSLLYEIHGEYKRTLVNLDQVPQYAKEATIAIEDKGFYKEGGISITGIIRAGIADVLTLRKSQGASTITQQFVKNAILTDNKSWDRKIREAILAIAIDAHFSKDQILQLYFNEIPYGRNAYGIEAASETYFNKSSKDLNLAESAYLAAMIQAPTYYNPLGLHRADLDARKNTVLSLMRQQGYINQEQEKQAQTEVVNFSKITNGIQAPHFVLWVVDYLNNKYGESTLQEGGLQVYTTLDLRLQSIAETVVKNNVDKVSVKYNAHNAALVAIDPKTGQVLAMVGSKDYFGTSEPAGCIPGTTGTNSCTFEPNVNVALSQRQPGSSFKPYVYGTAFKKQFGYAPASLLIDVVTNFGTYNGKDYIPHNYNNQSYGPVPMRKAMAGSLNVPAVKTLALVGVETAVQTAHDLGITSPLSDCGLSLVLGGCEVRLLDHVAAYSVIANEGVKNSETPILKVLDKNGNVLEQYQSNPQTVLDPQAAYELISIMTDNNARSFIFGANSPLILPGRVVAAKTGTTNNWHDGWTLGFTPSLAAGVWAGNNNGTLLKSGADGVVVAAPIWHDFMLQALATSTPETFAVPPGIQQVVVDAVSGKLPTDATPNTVTETFANYSVPTTYDNVHTKVPFDATTGLPATSLTSPGNIIYKIYNVLHSEMPNNPNWENPVVAWALANGYSYPPNEVTTTPITNNGQEPTVNILDPADGKTITQIPFLVTVNTSSSNQIARVDLSINGEFYQSLTSAPFVFSVNKTLTDGPYTIAAHAVDSAGATSDTSVSITLSVAAPLTLTQPLDQSLLQFPVNLIAASNNLFGSVNFYYQNSKGQTKLIGAAQNTDHTDQYNYTFNWDTSPPAGSYKIYAQSSNGYTSRKISVTIP